MKLKSVILKNFRGYQAEVRIEFDNLTVFVGKNDTGKSTILDALEIFFNNEAIKIDPSDASVGGDPKDVRIGCVFADLPAQLSIDARAVTSFLNEYLLNADGNLEIVKIFNCDLKTPKEKVYANAQYPTVANLNDLHSLTNDKLKNRIQDQGIDTAQVDLRSNVQLRHALWNSQPGLALAPSLVSLEEEDGKKIWDKLKLELPIYALFRSDRPSKDEDAEVQDPMKLAVQEAIKSVSADLEAIKVAVQQKAKERADQTLVKLKEMSPDLAAELTPRFKKEPKWDTLFQLTLSDESQIPINKRGSGTRRLILISFFRAEAERKSKDSNAASVIYAIEEPETSQHPSNQAMLINALSELANSPNSQVILTTHVPNLAGLVPIQSLRYVRILNRVRQVVNECDDNVLKTISNELGVLPDKRIQVLVCVEGPTDVTFITNLSINLNQHNAALPNLSSDRRIAVLPLGGSTLIQWVDNHYLRNLGLPEIHIYDRDTDVPPKYQGAVNAVNARNDNSWGTLTQKREFENYVHPDAVAEVFAVRIVFADDDDVSQILCAAVNAEPANPYRQLGESRAKKIIADYVSPLMTVERLRAANAFDEVVSWLQEISRRIN